MKYFRNIVMIILVSALIALGLNHYLQPPAVKEPLLTVGAVQYTLEDLEDRIKKNPYGSADRDYFVDSVIDRELLLQEAQRQRLDQEPSFSQAMQDFLEQSLVRLVADRFYDTLQPEVTDQQVERYIQLQKSCYKLQIFDYQSNEMAQKNEFISERIIEERYSILPLTMRDVVATLERGQLSEVMKQNNQLLRFKVLSISNDTDCRVDERDVVHAKLVKEMKSIMMDQWMDQLRAQATVTTTDQLERWKNDQQ